TANHTLSLHDALPISNPLGVSCGKNDKKLLEVSKEGYSFYRKIGVTSMEIVSKEVNLLDDFHAMVKVRWRSHFIKENSKETLDLDRKSTRLNSSHVKI